MTFDPITLVGAASAVIVFVLVVVLRRRGQPQLEAEENPQNADALAESPIQNRFLRGLRQTSLGLSGSLNLFFQGSADPEALEALEDALIAADVGVQTAEEVVQFLKAQSSAESTPAQLRAALAEQLLSLIGPDQPLAPLVRPLHVILVVGVNGSGKTTTIGKLAHRYVSAGKSVLVAPGDTFRAGAIEQLAVWAERSGATCLEAQSGSDPASVIYNAIEAARSKEVDVLICDTAGRLQSQGSLMDVLSKINRVIQKRWKMGRMKRCWCWIQPSVRTHSDKLRAFVLLPTLRGLP